MISKPFFWSASQPPPESQQPQTCPAACTVHPGSSVWLLQLGYRKKMEEYVKIRNKANNSADMTDTEDWQTQCHGEKEKKKKNTCKIRTKILTCPLCRPCTNHHTLQMGSHLSASPEILQYNNYLLIMTVFRIFLYSKRGELSLPHFTLFLPLLCMHPDRLVLTCTNTHKKKKTHSTSKRHQLIF